MLQLHQAMLAAQQMFVQAHELKELGISSDDTYAIHSQEHSLKGIKRAGAAASAHKYGASKLASHLLLAC